MHSSLKVEPKRLNIIFQGTSEALSHNDNDFFLTNCRSRPLSEKFMMDDWIGCDCNCSILASSSDTQIKSVLGNNYFKLTKHLVFQLKTSTDSTDEPR